MPISFMHFNPWGMVIPLLLLMLTSLRTQNRLITLSGCTATEVLKAILTLLPLDDFEPYPIKTMSQVDTDDSAESSLDFLQIISLSDEQRHQSHQVERFEFMT